MPASDRADRLINEAIAAGKLVESRRQHYRTLFARAPAQTEQLLATLAPVLPAADEGLPAERFRVPRRR